MWNLGRESSILGGRFGFFFFLLGERKGSSRRREEGGGGRFLIENSRKGLPGGWGGGGEGLGGCLRGIFGGGEGGKFFFVFRGRNSYQVLQIQSIIQTSCLIMN